ncbi:hypothetical protein ACVW0I_007953 [Bradyrhizobium sp. LM6.11]
MSITFIRPARMCAGMEGQRQLQDVLEIVGQHRLALAVREPVGLQGHERAAGDGEQPECHPGHQKRPGRVRSGNRLAGEHVDDPAEQHGFCELRGGKQEIGKRQQPAEPCFLAEQFENAGVETEDGHAIR